MIMVSYIIYALISDNHEHKMLARPNSSIRKYY